MRITLTEAERKRLIEKEKKERRLARLVQVRNQARAAAQSILAEVRTQQGEKAAELSARVQVEMRKGLMASASKIRRREEEEENGGEDGRKKEAERERKERVRSAVVDHSKQAARGADAMRKLKEERRAKAAEKLKAVRRMERAKQAATKSAVPVK